MTVRMISLVWIPKHSEPSDAASWQEAIERVYGDAPGGRVELEQHGEHWRVRMAIRFTGGAYRPRASAPVWYDLSDEVTDALQAAGKPVVD
jgi:hypothetical protein